ncbi:MAG: hypothetical protein SFV19_14620 [Rhodospirillaceae bacterium]|nr:hypothetical protein [Rhodospirillaceae bacterium]
MEPKPNDNASTQGLAPVAARISRHTFTVLAMITVIIEIAAIGPFGDHRVTGDLMASLLLLPILMAWAVGPYAVANKFAHEAEGSQSWAFVSLQVVMAVPALWIYGEAFFFSQGQDPQLGLIFVIIPIYQFVAVLAVYYALRMWTRHRG